MKTEIEELIEIYENREGYQARMDDAAKARPIPRLAELLNVQAKITFDKRRQRAELLKLNERFLEELSAIKNRLGEKFFGLLEETAETLEAYHDGLSKSDFAEPIIIIAKEGPSRHVVFPINFYFPLDAPEIPDDPCDDPDPPEYSIRLARDPLFGGEALEYIIVDEWDEKSDPGDLPTKVEIDYEKLRSPSFLAKCKEKIFDRYLNKWHEFLAKWHISYLWNGDLQYLHVHALPPVIVERDNKNHNMPVVIHLGAGATSDDVKRAWPQVKEIMKEAHVFRERESEDQLFIRDIIWFLLNKDEAFSPSKIAQFWAKKRPHEIDLEVIEKVMRDEEAFDGVSPKECLEEVLSNDPKMDELRGRFIEARKAFIRSGLADKVKKSIKKTREKIARLGSEKYDRNRERLFQRAVAPKDAMKILRSKYP